MLAVMTSHVPTTDQVTPAQMYAATRARLSDLFRTLSLEQLEAVVPSTPSWTVLDVARHLAGVADDIGAGRIEGAATDPWTAAQVEARKEASLDEVLSEWDAKAPIVEKLLDEAGPAAYRLVIDVVTHEQDVRGAVGLPGGRDEPSADWSLQQLVGGVDYATRRAGVGPLRIRGGTDEWIVGGEGEPVATVTAPAYELLRALIGRRSVGQIRAYEWEGDAEPFVELLPIFPAAATDITE